MPRPTSAQERLIFALDKPSQKEALELVDKLDGVVSFYKVGWRLFFAAGLPIVKELQARNFKVFLDIKLPDDIDATIKDYVELLIREKVDLVTLHGNGRMFAAASRAKKDAPLDILAVTVLSHLDESAMKDNYMLFNGSPYSFPFRTPEEYVRWKAETSVEMGCDGLIASGRFVKMLRSLFEERGQHPLLVVPGIRPEMASADEHANVLTPRQAIESGADYLVVGRPIRDAQRPKAAALNIIEEIHQALNAPAPSSNHSKSPISHARSATPAAMAGVTLNEPCSRQKL